MTARVRSWLRRGLALTAFLIGGGVLRADAPAGQYVAFDRSATCITDRFTGLTWTRAPFTDPTSGATAFGFLAAPGECSKLDPPGGPPVWRVPSVNELETLVDDFPKPQSDPNGDVAQRAIDANAFPGTPVGSPYWTSSPSRANSMKAWAVEFGLGSTSTLPIGTPLPVRCVTDKPKPASCVP